MPAVFKGILAMTHSPPDYSEQKAIGHGADGINDLGMVIIAGAVALLLLGVAVAVVLLWPR
jgi:hypothetical protein